MLVMPLSNERSDSTPAGRISMNEYLVEEVHRMASVAGVVVVGRTNGLFAQGDALVCERDGDQIAGTLSGIHLLAEDTESDARRRMVVGVTSPRSLHPTTG